MTGRSHTGTDCGDTVNIEVTKLDNQNKAILDTLEDTFISYGGC